MNETGGVVVRVEGERAWVRAEGAGNACGACARRDGCATAGAGSVLDGTLGRSGQLLCLPNTIHARPGDAVVIRAADGMVLRAVGLAYALPLLLAIGGALLVLRLFASEAGALLGMLAGLLAGFAILRRRGLDSGRGEPILSIAFKQSS